MHSVADSRMGAVFAMLTDFRFCLICIVSCVAILWNTLPTDKAVEPVGVAADQGSWFPPFYLPNCFELLKEPLKNPPFDEEIGRLIGHFHNNFDVNRTGAIIASPGATPALSGSVPGGYRYHWIRDGGLSMSSFLDVADTFSNLLPEKEVESTFLQYVDWVELLHSRPESTIDEPKWNIQQAQPYAGGWCRPQTDGPPIRAKTLLQGARRFKQHAGKLWNLAKKDLDWLVTKQGDGTSNINKETCDLWEETRSTDLFWNKAVMESALLEGIQYSQQVGDSRRAKVYLAALKEDLGQVTARHTYQSFLPWAMQFLMECPSWDFASQSCKQYRKEIDGAVILALVHGRKNSSLATVPLPTSTLVAETVTVYNKHFCNLYEVNKADGKNALPGVLYGRYEDDQYGGKDGGNPWVLITAALADLFYQAGEHSLEKPLTQQEIDAWRVALRGEDDFSGSPGEFLRAGDSVMVRLQNHIHPQDHWHLFEQINRSSGRQYNAKDLTWSYAEVLKALVQRKSLVSKLPPHDVVAVRGEREEWLVM